MLKLSPPWGNILPFTRTLYDAPDVDTSTSPAAGAPKLDWALWHARCGRPVFPCRENDKPPAVSDWQSWATCDPATITAHWREHPGHNIGLSMGGGIVALDLDRKNDLDGVAALDTLAEENFMRLPATFTQRTPTGGEHHILATDHPLGNSRGSLPPGIDVRGVGGFVVGAGSTINGKAYAVANDAPVAALPSWLAKIIGASRDASERQDAGKIELTALRGLLAHIDPTDRHQWGTVGAIVRDATITAGAAELDGGAKLALFDHWAKGGFQGVRCRSYAGPDECSTIFETWQSRAKLAGVGTLYALARANGYPGPREPGAAFDAIDLSALGGEVEVDARRDGKLHFEPFSTLLSEPAKPVEELVAGWVEKGITTFLAGPGGSNKSRLAIQIGLSVEAGRDALGGTTERATFVYLSSEDDREEVKRRGQRIAARLGIASDGGAHYLDCRGRDSALAVIEPGKAPQPTPFHASLRDKLKAMPGHKFVVLDSCYDFAHFARDAKIDEGAVRNFLKMLDTLCVETDSTLLVIWHPSQAGAERGDMSGWSVAWHNAHRARLSLSKDREGGAYTLKVEKRNHGPEGAELKLVWPGMGLMLPHGALAEAEADRNFDEAVVALAIELAKEGTPFTQQRKPTPVEMDKLREGGHSPTERVHQGRAPTRGADKQAPRIPARARAHAGGRPPAH